jgi:DNA primase
MNLLDLLSRDTSLRKVASTHGGEYATACPWCGGKDRFRVWPDADRPGYWCRQCDRKGDAIQYLREHDGLSYREACEQLGHPLTEPPRSRPTPRFQLPRLASAPGQTWQAKARAFAAACEHTLWTSAGAKALSYLQQRGLHEETIQAVHIGYHAAEQRESREAWGLAPGDQPLIWLPRGIVFPWWVHQEL